jgi:3D (Asp-Asp-Asp) domain-containing protein
MILFQRWTAVLLTALLFSSAAYATTPSPGKKSKLVVTATAHNSVHSQTDSSPLIGAWGDRIDKLPKGTRSLAVSQDLLRKGLLKYRQRVRIKGVKGDFIVLDKMPSQWTNRIDLHMGKDVAAAQRWGKKRVEVIPHTPKKQHTRTTRRE